MGEVCFPGVGFAASLCVFLWRGTPIGRLGGSADGLELGLVLRWAAFVLQRVCAERVGGVVLGSASRRACGYSFLVRSTPRLPRCQ